MERALQTEPGAASVADLGQVATPPELRSKRRSSVYNSFQSDRLLCPSVDKCGCIRRGAVALAASVSDGVGWG